MRQTHRGAHKRARICEEDGEGSPLYGQAVQKYPKIVESMDSRAERYNECMARLQELEQEGKIFVIAPESTYGVGRTTTDVIKLRRLYDEGYELTEKRMQELRAYLG